MKLLHTDDSVQQRRRDSVQLLGRDSRRPNAGTLHVDEAAAVAAVPEPVSSPKDAGAAAVLRTFSELVKLRVAVLILVTTFAGFALGASMEAPMHVPLLLTTLLGTGLVAGGAAAMNQVLERDFDRRMERTRSHPVPGGRVAPRTAMWIAFGLVIGGTALLALGANIPAAALALLTAVLYVCVYTPLKRVTHFCTVVGAVPGALPPLIGWAAASGGLALDAGLLFGLLFLWQLPHFLAIAWLYRDDYARGGFPMLPVVDKSGRSTLHQVLINSLALLPASLSLTALGRCGVTYFWAALLSGLVFLALAVAFALRPTRRTARRLAIGSILYIAFLFVAMVVDYRGWL